MTEPGELAGATTPPTYAELQAKYLEEAKREYDGSPPWGGEREERFFIANDQISTVFNIATLHTTLRDMTEGQSGILTQAQFEAFHVWKDENAAFLAVAQQTKEVISSGTAFGFVEGQVADLETVAAAGLELFPQPQG